MIAWVLAGAVVLGSGQVVARGEQPTWSRQGKLAYVRDGALHVGGRTFKGKTPAWSPDGTRIAFTRWSKDGWNIWVARADGSGAKRIARNANDPTWSRDGRTIAFSSNRDGADSNIWSMRPDGTHLRKLTTSIWEDAWPAFSPDGKTIAYTNNGELWTMRADGSHKRRIHKTVAVDNWGPAWSPDGRTIAFVALQRGSKWVYTIGADGTGLRRVAKGDEPAFRP
jgi:TolB protein